MDRGKELGKAGLPQCVCIGVVTHTHTHTQSETDRQQVRRRNSNALRHGLALTSCRDDVTTTTLTSPPSAAAFLRSVSSRFVSRK